MEPIEEGGVENFFYMGYWLSVLSGELNWIVKVRG